MGMREDFEAWAEQNFATHSVGAWLVWQKLYPEMERLRELVPSAYSEGFHAGEHEQNKAFLGGTAADKSERWRDSTTKAKLEGKEVMGITVAKLEADND